MLEIKPLELDAQQLQQALSPNPSGLMVTSRYALNTELMQRLDKKMPIYAVGDKTAKAIIALGFDNVYSGAGGLKGLIALIKTAHKALSQTPLLYLRGEDIRMHAHTALAEAGINVQTLVTYKAKKVQTISIAAFNQIQERLSSGHEMYVLLFSRRTAENWNSQVDCKIAPDHVKQIHYVCLSDAVAQAIDADDARIHTAIDPTQAALIECLKQRIEDNEQRFG